MIRHRLAILVSMTALLNVFFLIFGNSPMFPLGSVDFFFLVALVFLSALYRPGWAFLLFLGFLSFESMRLSPDTLLLSVRPYQLAGSMILLALFLRFLFRRVSFPFVKPRWFDVLPAIFALGGFVALFSVSDVGSAAKQAVVVLSFVALYYLSRQFFGGVRDARRVFPFLLIPTVFSALFALWQSVRFSAGQVSFEAMPGRPNAFFPEPDWLGMYFIFALSLALAFLFLMIEKGLRGKGSMNSATDTAVKSFGAIPSGPSFVFIAHSSVLTVVFLGLVLTVARSAWVGAALSSGVFLKLLLVGEHPFLVRKWAWKRALVGSGVIAISLLVALGVVWAFRLTTFDLIDRAGSTASGQQEITVSCIAPVMLPRTIESISELSPYGCRHIRLEEIDSERHIGRFVSTVFRPDPSIEARKSIREKTMETLKEHGLFGIGWGGIGALLGTDDRGAALNASNAFLEAWLGGGLMSGVAFLVLWMLIPFFAIRRFFSKDLGKRAFSSERAMAVFFLTSWAGFTVFNLFNSGILLGFVWVWLGGIGLIADKKREEN